MANPVRGFVVPVSNLEPDADCFICQEDFPSNDAVTHPGDDGKRHQFHLLCVDQWVNHYTTENRKNTAPCPVCKYTITHLSNGALIAPAAIQNTNDDDSDDDSDDGLEAFNRALTTFSRRLRGVIEVVRIDGEEFEVPPLEARNDQMSLLCNTFDYEKQKQAEREQREKAEMQAIVAPIMNSTSSAFAALQVNSNSRAMQEASTTTSFSSRSKEQEFYDEFKDIYDLPNPADKAASVENATTNQSIDQSASSLLLRSMNPKQMNANHLGDIRGFVSTTPPTWLTRFGGPATAITSIENTSILGGRTMTFSYQASGSSSNTSNNYSIGRSFIAGQNVSVIHSHLSTASTNNTSTTKLSNQQDDELEDNYN